MGERGGEDKRIGVRMKRESGRGKREGGWEKGES